MIIKVENQKSNIKAENAITLVALIVTIVILIILAGIGINLSLGDNGIFTKAKQAKENYEIAVNEEEAILKNVEKIMDGEFNNEESNPSDSDSNYGEYFYKSYNGFDNTLGTGKINSLYGLTAISYDGLYCRYEKNINHPFDLSKEFEISFKSLITTTSVNDVGGIYVRFQKMNDQNTYDDIISIRIGDHWISTSSIYMSAKYGNLPEYEAQHKMISTRNARVGIIGDGTNIKIYDDDTLLTTWTQQNNLSFDKIVIDFYKFQGAQEINKNYLENLYFGNIKYYKDII